MIDVSGHIDKMEKLKEYIWLCIDSHPIGFTTKEILDIFYQTGYLLKTKYKLPLSFQDYLSSLKK